MAKSLNRSSSKSTSMSQQIPINVQQRVFLLTTNAKGDILLLRKHTNVAQNTKNQTLGAQTLGSNKSQWIFPGAECKINETIEQALLRIVREQTGNKITTMRYFTSTYVILSGTQHARDVYFVGQISGDVKLNPEISEHKWFANSFIFAQLALSFNQNDVLQKYLTTL